MIAMGGICLADAVITGLFVPDDCAAAPDAERDRPAACVRR
jgi:hypothetical protein